MSALQNAGAERALKGLLTGTVYIALFVGSTEVSGGGYARESVALANWTFSNNTATNKNKITFGNPTADWGDVTKIKLMSASSGEAEYAEIDLSNDPDVITASIDEVFFAPQAIRITLPLDIT